MKLKNICTIRVNKIKEDSLKAGTIGIVTAGVNMGKVEILTEDSSNMYLIGINSDQAKVSNKQLCEILQNMDLKKIARGNTLPRIFSNDVMELIV